MVIIHKGLTPEKAHTDDAAYDLIACVSESVTLDSLDRKLIPTGTWAVIPEGYVGLICPRSGLALKKGLTVLNAPGVIDPSYRGEIGVVLVNLGKYAHRINPGDRIAQLLLVRTAHATFTHDPVYFDALASRRGAKGFGSTGQ